jgi:hypothetical protein
MDDQPRRAVQEAERVQRGIRGVAALGATAVNLALIATFWGQWRVVLVVAGVDVGLALSNAVFLEWLATKTSRARNVAGISLAGIHTRWSVLLWVFVPYNMPAPVSREALERRAACGPLSRCRGPVHQEALERRVQSTNGGAIRPRPCSLPFRGTLWGWAFGRRKNHEETGAGRHGAAGRGPGDGLCEPAAGRGRVPDGSARGLQSGPRRRGHPRARGVEPGAATTHNSPPLSSSKGGQVSRVPHGGARPPSTGSAHGLAGPSPLLLRLPAPARLRATGPPIPPIFCTFLVPHEQLLLPMFRCL